MRIQSFIQHDGWSDRIRRRGIRRVAREAKIDAANLSRIVNDKTIVRPKTLEKLRIATNNLKAIKSAIKNSRP